MAMERIGKKEIIRDKKIKNIIINFEDNTYKEIEKAALVTYETEKIEKTKQGLTAKISQNLILFNVDTELTEKAIWALQDVLNSKLIQHNKQALDSIDSQIEQVKAAIQETLGLTDEDMQKLVTTVDATADKIMQEVKN